MNGFRGTHRVLIFSRRLFVGLPLVMSQHALYL